MIYQQQYQRRASDLFGILLGYQREKPAPGAPPEELKPQFAGLTPEQVGVLEQLDSLARDARRYWLVRDVEPLPKRGNDPAGVRELPPTPAMDFRLSDRGRRVSASIVAHAEEMALDAVLTPEQAEQVKVEVWRRRGVHALLDPELAARLHLSRTQRDELTARLSARVEVYHRLVRTVGIFIRGRTPPEEIANLEQRGKNELAQKVSELDQPIWDVLQPAQLRFLARLLNKPVAGNKLPTTKPSNKRAVRGG